MERKLFTRWSRLYCRQPKIFQIAPIEFVVGVILFALGLSLLFGSQPQGVAVILVFIWLHWQIILSKMERYEYYKMSLKYYCDTKRMQRINSEVIVIARDYNQRVHNALQLIPYNHWPRVHEDYSEIKQIEFMKAYEDAVKNGTDLSEYIVRKVERLR